MNNLIILLIILFSVGPTTFWYVRTMDMTYLPYTIYTQPDIVTSLIIAIFISAVVYTIVEAVIIRKYVSCCKHKEWNDVKRE